jgi:hypothetical protein
METKIKKVALHLIKYKKITSWDAITKYKATRLGAIIFNLRKKGLKSTILIPLPKFKFIK